MSCPQAPHLPDDEGPGNAHVHASQPSLVPPLVVFWERLVAVSLMKLSFRHLAPQPSRA